VASAGESLVSSSSFMLGIIGGLLDFASATTIVINQGSGMMASFLFSGYVWAAILLVLGVVVVVVAALSVMVIGMRYLRGFSLLMVALGIIMLVIGSIMSTGSIVGSSVIYSYGMAIVGILMAINGVTMLRSPMPI
jgi:hypothetical protein